MSRPRWTRAIDLSNAADREHRRHHRPGVPSKLDRDPQMRGWIESRIFNYSFAELAQLARAEFGPERAPSKSVLATWFRRNEQQLLGSSRSPKVIAASDGPDIGPGSAVYGRGTCSWCDGRLPKSAPQQPHRRFCSTKCRQRFHNACRRYTVEKIATGELSIAELRRHAQNEETS